MTIGPVPSFPARRSESRARGRVCFSYYYSIRRKWKKLTSESSGPPTAAAINCDAGRSLSDDNIFHQKQQKRRGGTESRAEKMKKVGGNLIGGSDQNGHSAEPFRFPLIHKLYQKFSSSQRKMKRPSDHFPPERFRRATAHRHTSKPKTPNERRVKA